MTVYCPCQLIQQHGVIEDEKEWEEATYIRALGVFSVFFAAHDGNIRLSRCLLETVTLCFWQSE